MKPLIHLLLPLKANGAPESTGSIRVVQPLMHPTMAPLLDVRIEPSPGTFLPHGGSTVMVFRDAIRTPDRAKRMVHSCKEAGARLVYETDDDLLHVPRRHPSASRFAKPVCDAIEYIVRHAHAVIVSTSALKNLLSQWCPRIHVLPNALDETLWGSQEMETAANENQVRVIYMGTRTHTEDLATVEPVVKKLKREYTERVAFHVVGGYRRRPPRCFQPVQLPAEGRADYSGFVRWWVSHARYDIALSPLADTPFNRAKSAIKYLDYGMCGLPAVYSNVTSCRDVVRHGETGLLANNNPDAWYTNVRELIENADLRSTIAQRARAEVRSHHTLSAQAPLRRQIWKDILEIE